MPDWCDPIQYPCDRPLRLRQWAWKFLRRNPEYRSLWRACIEPFYDPAFSSQDVGLVGPAHGVPAIQQAVLVHQHRFGLEFFPPSPNDDYPPLFTVTGLRWTEEREARLSLTGIAVIFDLTQPIKSADGGGEEALCR